MYYTRKSPEKSRYLQYIKVKNTPIVSKRKNISGYRLAPIASVEGHMDWIQASHRRNLDMLRFCNRVIRMSDSRITKMVFKWKYGKYI